MPPSYTYNVATGHYVTPTGHPVPPAVLLDQLTALIADSQARLRALTAQVLDGTLSHTAFRDAVQTELQTGHGLAAALAHGGAARIDASLQQLLGTQLRTQGGYLQNFVDALLGDRAGSDDQVLTRIEQYASAYHATYVQMQHADAGARGVTEERNILRSLFSCYDCESWTRAGWVPYDTIPAPGGRTCRSNCRCILEFR